ncbi:hypothetical protein Dimus_016470 [Dionaea muscipula]
MATLISSSSPDSASSGNVRVTCRCNRQASVYTSNTRANPFRRFYECKYYRTERGCDTWGWIDNELPTRVTMGIMKLMDQVDSLTKELEETKERSVARLKSKDTIIKMLTFVVVVLVILLIK